MNNKYINVEIKKKQMNIGSIILTVFLVIQPLLDFNVFFQNESFTVFGITYPTIIRYVFLVIFSLYIVYQVWKENIIIIITDRFKKILLLLLILLFSYIGIHLVLIRNKSTIYNLYSASIPGELSYLFRVLVPIIILFYVYIYQVHKKISFIMIGWFVLVPVAIVVTNLNGTALSSYTNQTIAYTFFDWFSPRDDMSFLNTGSKAFFRFANQISMFLAIILPYFSFKFFKKTNFINGFYIIVLFLSMAMLGTRVSLYSSALLFTVSYICYLIYDIVIGKNKLSIKGSVFYIALMVIFVLIVPFTPSFLRSTSTSGIIDITDKNENDSDNISNSEDLVIEKHEHNMNPTIKSSLGLPLEDIYKEIDLLYSTKRIDVGFLIETYPYTEDPDFWFQFLQLPSSKLMNNRFVEQSILQRVKDLNQQPLDSLFGMGYSRMMNLYSLEKDFISQYYTLGMLGVLLFFGIYLVPIVLLGIITCKGKLFKIDYEFVTALIPVIFVIPISLFSGNIFDSLLPTIVLSLMISNVIHLYFN